MPSSSYVVLGKIVKAHGIRGEVEIYAYSPDIRGLVESRPVFLETSEGVRTSYKVETARPKKKHKFILSFEGVDNRDQAEALVGNEICVLRESLPELPEDEYYWHELIGMRVKTVEHEDLGRLSKILSTGAHDVLVVEGPYGEVLIPMVAEMIENVDIRAGVIIVNPVPGLLDVNAL